MAARIGELLVSSGLIGEEQVSEALELQKESRKKLGEILIELGYINDMDLTRMLNQQAIMRDGPRFRHWPFIP